MRESLRVREREAGRRERRRNAQLERRRALADVLLPLRLRMFPDLYAVAERRIRELGRERNPKRIHRRNVGKGALQIGGEIVRRLERREIEGGQRFDRRVYGQMVLEEIAARRLDG